VGDGRDPAAARLAALEAAGIRDLLVRVSLPAPGAPANAEKLGGLVAVLVDGESFAAVPPAAGGRRRVIAVMVGVDAAHGRLALSAAAAAVASAAATLRARTGRDDPLWCPRALDAATERAPLQFDARALVGLPFDRARDATRALGCRLRVIDAGGAIRRNLRGDRVNVRVADERVVRVSGVG
jgi:hypothetical protein